MNLNLHGIKRISPKFRATAKCSWLQLRAISEEGDTFEIVTFFPVPLDCDDELKAQSIALEVLEEFQIDLAKEIDRVKEILHEAFQADQWKLLDSVLKEQS